LRLYYVSAESSNKGVALGCCYSLGFLEFQKRRCAEVAFMRPV
jgi:hypothetical protein